MDPAATLAGLGTAWIMLAALVAILWVFLPFAVYGIKGILKEIRDNQMAMRVHMERAEARATGRDTDTPPSA